MECRGSRKEKIDTEVENIPGPTVTPIVQDSTATCLRHWPLNFAVPLFFILNSGPASFPELNSFWSVRIKQYQTVNLHYSRYVSTSFIFIFSLCMRGNGGWIIKVAVQANGNCWSD